MTPTLRANGHAAPVHPTPRTISSATADAGVGELAEAKRAQGVTVSVCLPARDEEATVGQIVESILTALGGDLGVVDEVLVVDDGSTDATASIARSAGATVVAADEVLPEEGPGTGKGEALWKSLAASSGDVVVWCDADISNFDPRFVTRLVAPLLLDDSLGFVKGFYERPSNGGLGGGRVTELVARPVVALLLPWLSPFVQPLAGEYAGRRSALEILPFEQGYGVDIGLLADLALTIGLDAMAQVDLGSRAHRNRPLTDLTPQATAVMRAAMRRTNLEFPDPTVLALPDGANVVVDDGVRPPLVDVPGYARRVS